MQFRWPLRIVGWAVLFVVLPAAIGSGRLLAQEDLATRLAESLNYPDEEVVALKYARVVVEIAIAGSHAERHGNSVVTETASLSARVSYIDTLKASTVVRTVAAKYTSVEEDVESGTKTTTTSTVSFAHTLPTELNAERSGAKLRAPVSEKLAATHFDLDTPLSPWNDIPGQRISVYTAPDGRETIKEETSCSVIARVPYYSLARGTPFADLARRVESAGDREDLPVGGIVESVWRKGGSSGSFSVPVMASCAELFFIVNTRAAWAAQDEKGTLFPGVMRVSWNLALEQPRAEMTIAPAEPEAYSAWIPAPAPRDGVPGEYGKPSEPLAFRITMKAKEPGRPPPQSRMDFYLCDVSQEKGVCTNYPRDGDTNDDFRFVPDPPDLVIDPADPRHAYTRDGLKLSEFFVEVEALDTGAYGRLQATCDEHHLLAEYEPTGELFVTIPRDFNQNRVADQWERDKGIYDRGLPTTWDEDANPAGQRRPGDGYTLYEEYRGFMTSRGFTRTQPDAKDLFVYDKNGFVQEFYEPYKPAGLELHFIDATMMKFDPGALKSPENRWVNTNTSEEYWYARQFAIFVTHWDLDQTAGECLWRTNQDAALKQPVKECAVIRMSRGVIQRIAAGIPRGDPQAYFNAQMTRTVIHEMGHAVGLRHHQPPDGGDETEYSIKRGVFECAMRYDSRQEEAHPELMKPLTRYCRKGETWTDFVTKKDDDGNKTTREEKHPSDDCFGQIDVKSDPERDDDGA